MLELASTTESRLPVTATSVTTGDGKFLFVPESRRDVVLIPASQAYYWKPAWQREERLAVEDIAAGRVREFATAADAALWLLDD